MISPLQHGDVTQLRFSTWKSRVSSMAVSAFVCDGVLIDSGAPDTAPALLKWIAANPIKGAIITHAHEDHSGAVPSLAKLGIPVHTAPDTEAMLRADESVGLYRRFCWGPRRILTAPLKPFESSRFRLRPARGHSVDHHVVWDNETDTVFCGDLFVGMKVRVAHHNEDMRQQIDTLRDVASWNPARVFDAHRGLLPNPVSLLNSKADWIERTVAEIEALARKGMNDISIRDRVLGHEDTLGVVSFGDYSRLNFVRSVRASAAGSNKATTGASQA